MQILLRANLLAPLADPQLDLCRTQFFPAPGKRFYQLLEFCRATATKVVFLRDMRWSAQEMRLAKAFLVARGQTVAQPRALYDKQQAHAIRSGKIRGFRPVFMNRTIPSGSFRFMDQWSNELLAAEDVGRAWPAEFRGAQLEAIPGAEGLLHVFIHQAMAPTTWDDTLCWDDSTPRHRGTLCYPEETLRGDWDLARTAEPFGCQGTGLVLASRRFYQWYRDQGWKGLHFWPVWADDSAQCREHQALWREVLASAEVWC